MKPLLFCKGDAAEELKNTIGNLTIMDCTQNIIIGNNDFAAKRPIFRVSSMKMNHEIAHETSWDRAKILTRTERLKDMAVKVFKMI